MSTMTERDCTSFAVIRIYPLEICDQLHLQAIHKNETDGVSSRAHLPSCGHLCPVQQRCDWDQLSALNSAHKVNTSIQ